MRNPWPRLVLLLGVAALLFSALRSEAVEPSCGVPGPVVHKIPVKGLLPPKELQFEVYRDARKEWRWRLKARNNKIIADSGEGYHNKADCEKGLELVRNAKDKAESGYKLLP